MNPEHQPRAQPGPHLPPEAQALLATATRLETPCGTGRMVWHLWGRHSGHGGEGSQPTRAPVVLLHGGSGSWTHWLRTIGPLVNAGRRVLVPDLPGFGDSSVPPGGNDADAIPVPLAEGLQCLLGVQACDLVGFSFGGMVAGLVAAQFSARVAQLVLVGAPGLGIAPAKAIRLRAWRHLADDGQRDAVHRGNLAALMLLYPGAITDTALRLHVANVLRDRMQGRSLSRTDVLARALPQVRCPVHGIYGCGDALYQGTLQALEPALHRAPDFRGLAMVESAGHWVQFEQPAAFNRALLTALGPD